MDGATFLRFRGEKRRRPMRRPIVNMRSLAVTACVLSMTAVAFQPPRPLHRWHRNLPFESKRQVVTDPDAFLLDSLTKNRRNDEIERMYRMSKESDEFFPHTEVGWMEWLETSNEEENPVQFRGLSTTSRDAKGRRRSAMTAHSEQQALNSTTTAASSTEAVAPKPRSRSSTMPGFAATSDKERAHQVGTRLAERRSGQKINDTPEAKSKRRQANGQAMYHSSATVPDSMVQFANEIHREERISRQEEIELGEKTQEAVRLQTMYNVLRAKLNREPTDEEWCAAAGKINMEAIRQAIDEGLNAKNKLVKSNLRLVQSVVNTYIRNGLSAQYNAGDMMQEGILALIRAAEKFEPGRGWKFSTYAMYWVRSSVKRSQIQQSRILRIPQRLHENHKRLLNIEADLSVTLGRKPTRQEIGYTIGMSEAQVDRCFTAMAQRCYSLDQALTNGKKAHQPSDSETTLIEIIGSSSDDGEHDRLERALLREDLVETLHRHLAPEEVEVLLLRYGLKDSPELQNKFRNRQPTMVELGEIFNLKPDKVRRMIQKSLQQLQSTGPEEWAEFQRLLQ